MRLEWRTDQIVWKDLDSEYAFQEFACGYPRFVGLRAYYQKLVLSTCLGQFSTIAAERTHLIRIGLVNLRRNYEANCRLRLLQNRLDWPKFSAALPMLLEGWTQMYKAWHSRPDDFDIKIELIDGEIAPDPTSVH